MEGTSIEIQARLIIFLGKITVYIRRSCGGWSGDLRVAADLPESRKTCTPRGPRSPRIRAAPIRRLHEQREDAAADRAHTEEHAAACVGGPAEALASANADEE